MKYLKYTWSCHIGPGKRRLPAAGNAVIPVSQGICMLLLPQARVVAKTVLICNTIE